MFGQGITTTVILFMMSTLKASRWDNHCKTKCVSYLGGPFVKNSITGCSHLAKRPTGILFKQRVAEERPCPLYMPWLGLSWPERRTAQKQRSYCRPFGQDWRPQHLAMVGCVHQWVIARIQNPIERLCVTCQLPTASKFVSRDLRCF